jgi:7-cyano-7-deazaguanine reductase
MSNDILNSIASKHLGKAGDGSVVKPYVTPNVHDKSLLVPVPRKLNREQYGIEESKLPFTGYDLWNAYEISFMLSNGYPVSGIGRLKYSSSSPNIVESKSLKLYFNSFNMESLGKTVEQAVKNFEKIVVADLSEAIGKKVEFRFLSPVAGDKWHASNFTKIYKAKASDASRIESVVDMSKVKFEHYNEAPDLLEKIQAPVKRSGLQPQFITTNALRSNCRVTNQPDWGDVYVYVKGDYHIDPTSFLKYIVSMRRENHFHEEICEAIFKRLQDVLGKKAEILVLCLYTRRGGIDINPIRATSEKLMKEVLFSEFDVNESPVKTLRQ